ncbi:MAG TPA: crossover junction endodeoxyribonuclease RuvC [Longimicrobium sp.]|nr:crossover junction endodeoxyribonuclease RuvC [Longimicrobium sp.]
MKIAAFDLSLTQTGYAVVDTNWAVRQALVGVVRTSLTGMARLDHVRKQVMQRVEGADAVVLEGYSYGQRAGTSQAHSTGELGGVIRLSLWRANIPFVDIAPTKLKKYATGSGKGGKHGPLVEAVKRLGYDGSNDNEADALWLLHMGLDAYGLGWAKLPEAHREALQGVAWPALAGRVPAHA